MPKTANFLILKFYALFCELIGAISKATTTHSWRANTKLIPLPHWLQYSKKKTSRDKHFAKVNPVLAGAQNTWAHSRPHHVKGPDTCTKFCDFYNLQGSCLSFFQEETQAYLWRIYFNSLTAFCSLLQKFHFPRQTEIIPKQAQYVKFLIGNFLNIPQSQGHLQRK